MAVAPSLSPEQIILRARARDEVSADAAFEQIYALYARNVMSWLRFSTRPADVDDLFQDVWTFFYRLQKWQDGLRRAEQS